MMKAYMTPPLLFYVSNRRQPDQPGYVHCRVTVDKRNVEFATGVRVQRADWHADTKQVRGRSVAARNANNRLLNLCNELESLFAAKERAGDLITAESLVREFRRGTSTRPTLLQAWAQFNEQRQRLVGLEITKERAAAHALHRRHVEAFLQHRRSLALLPEQLTVPVVEELQSWLRTAHGVSQNHAAKVAQSVKQVLTWAVGHEVSTANPLAGYRLRYTPPASPVFLSGDELQRLKDFTFASPPLRAAADCFLFQCYTGVAYADLARFRRSQHTRLGPDGYEWLYMQRQKTAHSTGQAATIRLLPEALRLLAYYGDKLPVPTNQVYNRYLKEVAAVLGFDCLQLTSHMGRKTAGAQLLLAGVRIEAVSKILGHSSITMTQAHYVSITDNIVAQEMRRVYGKLPAT
ncbi:MAG: tyrosine-type recombinase/integrase [Janthinobacterium lividum]